MVLRLQLLVSMKRERPSTPKLQQTGIATAAGPGTVVPGLLPALRSDQNMPRHAQKHRSPTAVPGVWHTTSTGRGTREILWCAIGLVPGTTQLHQGSGGVKITRILVYVI